MPKYIYISFGLDDDDDDDGIGNCAREDFVLTLFNRTKYIGRIYLRVHCCFVRGLNYLHAFRSNDEAKYLARRTPISERVALVIWHPRPRAFFFFFFFFQILNHDRYAFLCSIYVCVFTRFAVYVSDLSLRFFFNIYIYIKGICYFPYFFGYFIPLYTFVS